MILEDCFQCQSVSQRNNNFKSYFHAVNTSPRHVFGASKNWVLRKLLRKVTLDKSGWCIFTWDALLRINLARGLLASAPHLGHLRVQAGGGAWLAGQAPSRGVLTVQSIFCHLALAWSRFDAARARGWLAGGETYVHEFQGADQYVGGRRRHPFTRDWSPPGSMKNAWR